MFYIDLNSANIGAAKKTHFDKFRCYINRRIGNAGCNLPKGQCSICDSRLESISVDQRIISFLNNLANLSDILIGDPNSLLSVDNRFWVSIFPNYNFQTWRPYFDKKHIHSSYNGPHKAQATSVFAVIKDLKRILDYDWFTDKKNKHYDAYKLSDSLNRSTCTYCNRAYTSTVILKVNGQCITRPTLDHWYPKSEYPLLAVSFQNLIPSCFSCNSSVKGTVQLNLTDHIHPYVDITQNEDFQFGYFYSTSLNKYRIFVQNAPTKKSKSRDTLKAMFVDEIYNVHHPELDELLSIKKNYSQSYIKKMHNLLDHKLTKEEVYRLLFGVYYENKDFYKRPLGKFKFDILSQLGMLTDMDEDS
jgi:hypothetical protein